jgi:hypothetical protein
MNLFRFVPALLALAALPHSLAAQRQPGHPIGKVTATGNLIHLELDSGAVAAERLFDLDHQTLRFTPDGSGYRIERVPLQWDADFGPALSGGSATLKNFRFPFSGKLWDTLNVASGSITFGAMLDAGGRGGRAGGAPPGNRTGAGLSARSGFQLARYPLLATVGRTFINMIPGIAALVKTNLNGPRYVKELADRVVVTWTISEPGGGIQAFSWTPTMNRVQAVLRKDGAIELSYNDVTARDGIVGVFPAVPAGVESLTGPLSPDVDLSAVTKGDGPFQVAYEGFHWPGIPRAQDVACSVITALGDKFDFIAMYSDFRVDNPEGGTPSTGPRGGNVAGIGSNTSGLGNYCSQGQLQWMFVEPVSTSAVQIQERSPDGRFADYNYAMSQIGHELGHRWAADARALVNGETIALGPVHWATGLQIPAAFPYSNPVEADAMGGSSWKDNGDGTYTQLDRDYYSPAKGFSWLGLYLMGLAKPEEVPPFFILRNLQRTGQQDPAGHPIYRGDKTDITIQDVIAAMGARVPDAEHSQKAFNTAIVVMTMPGKQPTPELLSAAGNIAAHWITYWSKTTGGRSVMTVNPR